MIGANIRPNRKYCIVIFFILLMLVISGITIPTFNSKYNNDSDLDFGNSSRLQTADKSTSGKVYYTDLDLTFDPNEIIHDSFGDFDILLLPNCEFSDIPGEPTLPYQLVSFDIPAGANLQSAIFKAEIIDQIQLEGRYNILPAQAPRPVSEEDPSLTIQQENLMGESRDLFEYNEMIYSSSEPYPSNIIQPYLETEFNGIRYGHIKVFPMQYQPVEDRIRLFTSIHVSITIPVGVFVQNGESITNTNKDLEKSTNTRSGSSKSTTSNLKPEDIKYVIITNSTNFYSNFYPLAEWKTKKGVPTKIVDNGWIKNIYSGNNTQEKIRNFIRDAKNTWGTKWVLLGGDISIIPHRGAYGKVGTYPADYNIPADLYYSDLDGNWDADGNGYYGEATDNVDLYADVYVGRAPVETTAEVDNFVTKTLKYERNSTYGFQLEMLFLAEKLDDNTDAGISKDYIGTTYVPSRFNITRLYQTLNNLTKTSALNQMSSGKGIINHAGHCNWNVMSIGSYSLVRDDVDSLTNKDKQGILYTIGCITTAFENNDCIAEHYLKNTKGGTVAFIGNSRYGWYAPGNPKGGTSNYYDQEFFNQLLVKDNYHIGKALADSKARFINFSKSTNAWRWVQFCLNLLGDPELSIYTDLPRNLSVAHPAQIYFGPQTVKIWVNDSEENTPIKKALVCLQGTEVYQYGFTNSEGVIEFSINPTLNEEINVTVTAYNYYPYEGNISKIVNDTKPPAMIIDQSEYGWFNSDPGNVIDIDFNSLDETDLSYAEYGLSPSGPWYKIFDKPRPKLYRPWNISKVWDSLDEGDNTICVRCYDSANPKHWVMGNFTIKKDTKSPIVTINQAEYGWYKADPGAVINVDFSYLSTGSQPIECSPLARAEYSINTPTGPWRPIFTSQVSEFNSNWRVLWGKLFDGTNQVYIRLFDEAGNEDNSLDSITFKRDTLPPQIVIRKNIYGWYSTDPGKVIDIDFTNGGNGSLLNYAQYKIGTSGNWKFIFQDDISKYLDNWALDWNELVEGTNTIYIRCFDLVGFEDITEDSFLFQKDTQAPNIKINKGIYGWYQISPGKIIDVDFFKVHSGSSPLDFARYRVYTDPVETGGTIGPWHIIFDNDVEQYTADWSVVWSDLSQGNNSIEIQLFDKATNNNVIINTVYFLKDTEPPRIDVNIEEYGWFNKDPGPIIDVDFSNDNSGSELSYAEYRVDEGSWIKLFDIKAPNYTTPWGIDWKKLVEGNNQIEIRVWDAAGFYAVDTISIQKDTTYPKVLINKNIYGWYNSDPGAVMYVKFYSGDGTPGIDCSKLDFAEYKIGPTGSWVRIFDDNVSKFDLVWSVNWGMLNEGINNIIIRVCDRAGNLYEIKDGIKFKKDTLAPSMDIKEDIYGWYNRDNGNVIDVDFYNLHKLGNDPKEPKSEHQSNVIKAQYKVQGSTHWIDIFNESVSSYKFNWNVSWELLAQGKNTIYLRLFDEAGNVYYEPSVNITILKDIKPPVVSISSEEFGWYNSDPGAVIDVDFSAGDQITNSPLKNAQYKLGAYGNWVDIFDESTEVIPIYEYNGNRNIPWEQIKEGANTVLIRTFDQAGNENLGQKYILVNRDTIGPEPPILISPVNNGQTIDSKPVHYWLEPTDPGANSIEEYHIQIDSSNTFESPLIDSTSLKLTFAHSLELPTGKYYWRVRAIDIVGNIGEWSTTWTFNVVSKKGPEANQPPTAVAGEDKVVFINELVIFNGSGSSDPENDDLTFIWYLDDDSDADGQGLEVKWRYPLNGSYQVYLEVFDNYGGYDYDTLLVTVLDIDKDSDNDGMSDEWEIYYGLDPYNPKDALEDKDNDGYLNNIEFAQGSAPQDSFSTPITANDKTPPKITHKKVVRGKQLNAIVISATVVDDDSDIKSVILYYKKKSDLGYNSLSMGNENIYSATIPASMVTLDDLEYYIEAVDNSKSRNTAYFGKEGQTLKRPSLASDIDIKVEEKITTEKDKDMLEDFQDTFNFESMEICLTVFILMIVLLISFGLTLGKAVQAKQLEGLSESKRTIHVVRGKNATWEGFELERIGEDEDLNLIADEAELEDF